MTNTSSAKHPSLLTAPVRKARTILVHDAEEFAIFLGCKQRITDFALTVASATERDKFFINGNAVSFALLDRIEQHIHASGPLFLGMNGFSVWDAKDMEFWDSLAKTELEVISELICILWAQGSVELVRLG